MGKVLTDYIGAYHGTTIVNKRKGIVREFELEITKTTVRSKEALGHRIDDNQYPIELFGRGRKLEGLKEGFEFRFKLNNSLSLRIYESPVGNEPSIIIQGLTTMLYPTYLWDKSRQWAFIWSRFHLLWADIKTGGKVPLLRYNGKTRNMEKVT